MSWMTLKVRTKQEGLVRKGITCLTDKLGKIDMIKEIDDTRVFDFDITPTRKKSISDPLLPGYILIKYDEDEYVDLYNTITQIPGVYYVVGSISDEEYRRYKANVEQYDDHINLWHADDLVINDEMKDSLKNEGLEVHELTNEKDIHNFLKEEAGNISEVVDNMDADKKERDIEFLRKMKEKYEELIKLKNSNKSGTLIRIPFRFIYSFFKKYGKDWFKPTHYIFSKMLAITAMPRC